MFKYSKQVLRYAIDAVDGKPIAKQWLKKHNREEVLHLINALTLRDSKAVEYLLVNKHFLLAAFVNSVWEDSKALKLLIDKKEYVLAAMANVINGDNKAKVFLIKYKFITHAAFAEKIQEKIQRVNDKNSNVFSGPIKE